MKKIELYGETFEVTINKKNAKKLKKDGQKIKFLANKVANTPNSAPDSEKEKLLNDTRDVVKKAMTYTLGDGVFDRLYRKVDYSVPEMVNIFFAVMQEYQKR